MRLTNNIGWCDATGNMAIGCSKKSPGCNNCYAERDTFARVQRHRGVETWGPAGVRIPVKGFAAKVRRLNKYFICDSCRELVPAGNSVCDNQNPSKCPTGSVRRIRLFGDSNSDWLDEKWPIETLADFLALIHECRNIDFLLLTKRPENWRKRLELCAVILGPDDIDHNNIATRWVHFAQAPDNVWFGVSVENQKFADERIPLLLKTPASVRFLSCEPLLGTVDIAKWLVPDECGCGGYDPAFKNCIDWVIVGGESGPKARPCSIGWIREIVSQCKSAGVPVFVKQLGARPHENGAMIGSPQKGDWSNTARLRDRKGGDPNEWPAELRIREFPSSFRQNAETSDQHGRAPQTAEVSQ
ncbi:MAG TPA: DUF5131 family protein [Candidatus Udaeobacter sp.]|jgi:protein gp37